MPFRPRTPAVFLMGGCAALLLLSGCAHPLDGFDVVTPQGRDIRGLFTLALAISALVFALVVGLLGYVLLRFRERPTETPLREPSQVSGNRVLETLWTVTPALILASMFVLAVQTMRTVYASMPATPVDPSTPVQVIGHQYWWEYRYPNPADSGQAAVITANEVHLPVGVPVRLDITAADVLHDFWVPQLGWKRDAITGKTNVLPARLDRAGVYDGICTNYCGTEHAWMRIRVVAEPQDQFAAWLAEQAQPARAPETDLAQRGQQVFLRNTCVSCHAVAGQGANGQVGPNLTHFGSRSILGAGVLENTPENLRRWVQNAQAIKPGVLMPAYLNLSDQDLDALTAYLESLR